MYNLQRPSGEHAVAQNGLEQTFSVRHRESLGPATEPGSTDSSGCASGPHSGAVNQLTTTSRCALFDRPMVESVGTNGPNSRLKSGIHPQC
jgi:hypothetical protein